MANCPWDFNYGVFCNGWTYEHIGCLLMETALFFAVGIIGTAIGAFILGYSIADFTNFRRQRKREFESQWKASSTSYPMDDT